MKIEIDRKIIDNYRSVGTKFSLKKWFYDYHQDTPEEIEKTKAIREKIDEYIRTSTKKEPPKYHYFYPEGIIRYRKGIGYISFGEQGYGWWDVYFFGKTEQEAYLNAILDFEMGEGREYEFQNRKRLNEDYSMRFLNNAPITNDDYHGPFYFAEHSIQGLRNYYGDNIPKELVKTLEEYVSMDEKTDFKYSYEQNCFIKKK